MMGNLRLVIRNISLALSLLLQVNGVIVEPKHFHNASVIFLGVMKIKKEKMKLTSLIVRDFNDFLLNKFCLKGKAQAFGKL